MQANVKGTSFKEPLVLTEGGAQYASGQSSTASNSRHNDTNSTPQNETKRNIMLSDPKRNIMI